MEREILRERTAEEIRRQQVGRNQAAIRLLDSWDLAADDGEQARELAELKVALDASRVGPRKLFP